MRILQRYIWRELALNFLGITTVLLAILLVYQGGAVLARAAELQYPAGLVLRLFALGAVQNVSLLLPFGLLLAVFLAFGRLYHDSEMVAAQACGLGARRTYVTVLAVAVPVAALVAWLSLAIAPWASLGETALRAAAVRSATSVPLQAGQFRSLGGGRAVVYARSARPDGELSDVFIKRTGRLGVETTVARRARYEVGPDGLAESIVLYDGQRYEGVPGSGRFQLVRFAEQRIPVQLPEAAAPARELEALPTRRLLDSPVAAERNELQHRLSWPLMALILSLCAVPLARLRPRQGRFARVGIAVLLFAVYANLLQVAVLWLDRGVVPARYGLWWVHGIFVAMAALVTLAPRVVRGLRHWRTA